MKRLLSLAAVAALCPGCLTGKLDKVVQALGKDPATTHIRISTIYGVLEVSRANPNSGSPTHTVAPDGTITVTGAPYQSPSGPPIP